MSIDEIRNRWANRRFPRIGYSTQRQAKQDIAALVEEIGRLKKREAVLKKTICAYDAIIVIRGISIIVPAIVKEEIERLQRPGSLP